MAGLPFKLCLFFAANPDECLYTSDVAEKFGKSRAQIDSHLVPVVRDGWIAKTCGAAGGSRREQRQSVYAAGPQLLQSIGRA